MHETIRNRIDYQDALDDLILNAALSSLLEIEGNELIDENEALKKDPRFQLTPEIDKKIQRVIKRAESKQRFKIVFKSAGSFVSKVAVIFLAVFLGITSTMAVSADFRRIIYNIILSYDERYTQVEKSADYNEFINSGAYKWGHIFAPTMIPAGYTLVLIEDFTTIYSTRYEKGESLYIEFTQIPGNGKARVDTENAQLIKNIYIGDSEALMVEKNGITTLTWQSGDFLLQISSNDQSDIVVNVAEGIKLMR